MSAEENKAVIRRAAQAASSGDFDAFDDLALRCRCRFKRV